MDAQWSIRLEREPAARPAAPGRGEVIPLEPYRRKLTTASRDDIVNTEWDHLARLAEDAWCWRDPESLAALGACVARLGLRSLEDWGF